MWGVGKKLFENDLETVNNYEKEKLNSNIKYIPPIFVTDLNKKALPYKRNPMVMYRSRWWCLRNATRDHLSRNQREDSQREAQHRATVGLHKTREQDRLDWQAAGPTARKDQASLARIQATALIRRRGVRPCPWEEAKIQHNLISLIVYPYVLSFLI